MKVIDRENARLVEFSSIRCGTAFKYGEEVYLRTEEVKNDFDKGLNGVHFKTGEMCSFSDYEKVEPLEDAKIICY